MRAVVWLAFTVVPLVHAADSKEVSIRSAAWSPPPPTISAQSNLVESGVTVYDNHGRAAGGFGASDFTLSDNGKPQPITVFSELRRQSKESNAQAETPTPHWPAAEATQARSIALFFDDLHLTAAGLPLYRKAAEKLILAGLRPGERMGIFTDSGAVTVDFTTDTAALLAALPRITTHRDPGERGMTTCPTLTTYSAFVIMEHIDEGEKERAVQEVMSKCGCRGSDACRQAAEGTVMDMAASVWENSRHYSTNALDVLRLVAAHLGKQDGSRVLVMVSGGFIDDGRMGSEKRAILEAAARAHVVIDSLAVESSMGYRQLVVTNTMVDAAAATGGRVIKNTNDLDGALSTLATAPEISYLLGFQPGDPDGKYHTLKVALPRRDGFKIESRPGYFALQPAAQTVSVQQRIDSIVLSRTVVRDVPATVRVIPSAQRGGYQVRVVIDVDAKHIEFARQSGLHLQQLTYVTVIEDGQGNFLTGRQAVMDLRVTPATLTSMKATGIHAVASFSLPKGSYVVREVVREMVQNHIGALNKPLDLQ